MLAELGVAEGGDRVCFLAGAPAPSTAPAWGEHTPAWVALAGEGCTPQAPPQQAGEPQLPANSSAATMCPPRPHCPPTFGGSRVTGAWPQREGERGQSEKEKTSTQKMLGGLERALPRPLPGPRLSIRGSRPALRCASGAEGIQGQHSGGSGPAPGTPSLPRLLWPLPCGPALTHPQILGPSGWDRPSPCQSR